MLWSNSFNLVSNLALLLLVVVFLLRGYLLGARTSPLGILLPYTVSFHLVMTLWLCECRPRGSSCRRWILWFHRSLATTIEWEIFLALIYLLSVCRCWRFVLDPVATEASLTFAWCTCYLHGAWRWLDLEDSWSSWLSSWCVEMVLHGMWRCFFTSWCVEMVASWGLIGFLVKVWFMLLFDMLSLV